MSGSQPFGYIGAGKAGGLSARINRHGAGLGRLKELGGGDWIWPSDFAGGVCPYCRPSYPLARPGFARHAMFSGAVDAAGNRAVAIETDVASEAEVATYS